MIEKINFMKKLIGLLFILFLSQNLFAQTGWVAQNPASYHTPVRKIFFINYSTGFGCGNGGNIIKTTNSGLTWFNIGSGIDFLPATLYFCNENTGWVGGWFGKIIRTTNGGASWQSLNSGITDEYINCLYFINTSTGFAGTGNGKILKTTNSGDVWTSDSFDFFAINDVKFINALTGYATPISQSVLKTVNGGLSWTEIPITPDQSQIFSSCFLNSETGWVATYSKVWKTTNSGLNWIVNYNNTSPLRISSVNFLDNQNGFIGRADGRILKTENSGTSWTELQPEVTGVIQILPIDLNKSFFVSSSSKIYRSTNGGINWLPYSASVTENYLSEIKFFNGNTGYIVGDIGTFLKTTNGGELWSVIPTPTTYRMRSLYFINQQTGWICGDGGTILKTTNAGLNWEYPIRRLPSANFNSITFINSLTGFALSGNDKLVKTTDSGISWNQIIIPDVFEYGKLYFINEQTGFCTGYDGYDFVIKTTDCGNTWSNIISSVGSYSSMYFIDENTGFGCGHYRMGKTTNGGLSWTLSLYLPDHFLNSVQFINSLTGYCCGTSGHIYKTTNCGTSWNDISAPHISNSNVIYFVNDSTGWLAGTDGSIFKTTTGGVVTSFSQTSSQLPENYLLKQNYPNPFNPSTKINYEIKFSNFVSLKVFDLLGKEVAALVNEKQNAGSYAVDFNSAEFNLPSGVYFYTLNTDDFSETKKMLLIK